MKRYKMELRLFGEAGGAGAGTGGTGAAGTVQAGTTTAEGRADTAEGGQRDFDAEFETMIKGDFKSAYDKRMQKAVQDRLKDSKQTQARLKEAENVLTLAAERYGLDGKDLSALRTALEGDKQYLEAEALEKGMTVEQLAQFKKMERENKAFQAQLAEAQQRQAFEAKYAGWAQEAAALKDTYPALDLAQEFGNPQFVRMLDNGVDVKTAYQAIHFDDLMGGALQHTAAQTEKKVLDSIKSRGLRPEENGTKGSGGAREKIDVTKLTKQQRQELIEEARRNPDKHISFG